MSAQPDDGQLDAPFCSGSIQWRRTAGEVRAEWERLEAKVAAVMPADLRDMNSLQRGVLGLWAAAAWTTGVVTMSPLTEKPTPVDLPAVIRESELSLDWSDNGDLPIQAYADGVRCWLGWITGGVARVQYPDEL